MLGYHQLCVCLMLGVAMGVSDMQLWPQPESVSVGVSSLNLGSAFKFASPSNIVEDLDIIKSAIVRYMGILAIPEDNTLRGSSEIKGCILLVEQDGMSSQPIINADEEYNLQIDADGACKISSKTVWGMLRGMERFTQVLIRSTDGTLQAPFVPTLITADKPRFGHRGLLIDTSRHFLPTSTIKHIIDALPMGNFNVLHWHLVDAQSFPYDSPSQSQLKKGAYTQSLIYSSADISDISSYAKDRGVEMIVEVDVPGHAASWAAGRPDIMADCFIKYSYNINDFALNPTLDETFNVLTDVLSDLITAASVNAKPNRIHLGGDEVVYGCWSNDTSILTYMDQHGMKGNYDQLLMQFVQRENDILAQALPIKGISPTYWEEVFTSSAKLPGTVFPEGVVFQAWTNSDKVASITQAGYNTIVSSSDYWYLDHADNTWQRMYDYDPIVGLTSSQAEKVIGGEVTMWAEKIDDHNIESIVFPRALAVGERLWTSLKVISTSGADAGLDARLQAQRCRMLVRGFYAAPTEPGFCQDGYV